MREHFVHCKYARKTLECFQTIDPSFFFHGARKHKAAWDSYSFRARLNQW